MTFDVRSQLTAPIFSVLNRHKAGLASMTDYTFTATYDNVPDGPLFFSELPNAWSDKTLTFYSVNGRTIQNAFAIVPGGGPQGQKCVRMTYPAGVVGGQGPGRGP